MSIDSKLEEQVKEFQNLKKENPNIDVALLLTNALQNQNQNMVSSKTKRWVYLASIGFPPVGFLIAIKFYLDSREDAKTVANMCVLLTAISLASLLILGKVIISSSGTSLQQIEQIKPSDIQQLSQ